MTHRPDIATPLDELRTELINKQISSYVQRWQQNPSIVNMGFELRGDGSVQDINALDYLVYEQITDLVLDKEDSFIELSSYVFGNSLVKILKFEWCELSFPSGKIIGLYNAYNNLIVPLEAVIAMRLSSDVDNVSSCDFFSGLLINIYLSKKSWEIGAHFLVESTMNFNSENLYDQYWGFVVPEDIVHRYYLLSLVDEAEAVRLFCLAAYDWINMPNWSLVRDQLSEVERLFDCSFTNLWRKWAKERYDAIHN